MSTHQWKKKSEKKNQKQMHIADAILIVELSTSFSDKSSCEKHMNKIINEGQEYINK